MPPRMPARTVPLVAALSGALLLAALGDPRAHAVEVVATMLVWGVIVAGAPSPAVSPLTVALAAAAVRIPLLHVAPTLSDDLWRYLWEGRVWLAGHNPFVYAPDAPALASLRDAAWAHVNHRSVPSIYPPLAQALFVLMAKGGPLGWKVLSATCDVGTAALLARHDTRGGGRAGWLWALLPLPAVESAVSGHLEGIGALLLVAAITTRSAAAAWLGAMVKLLPGVLLAMEPRRRWAGWALLTAAVTLPLVRIDGFETYRATWSFNGSIYPLAEALSGSAARPTLQVIGALVVLGALLRSRDRGRVALWTTGAFVILSPTVHPWYVAWPLAAALCAGSRAWVVLAVTAPLSYVVLSTYDPASASWEEWTATRWAIYLPFYAALAWEARQRLLRAGPAAVH